MTIAPLALDVTVVGAGQAGLVTGYFLKRAGLDVRLFDPARQVGDSWRRRYDSLVLFSPRSYSALPGLPMDGDPEGYPTKDEAASYLEQYARTFALPVTVNDGVARLDREEDRFVAVTTQGRRIVSRAVVVATGAFQKTRVPGFASSLSPRVTQLCAEQFRHPHQLPDGRVLVVGGGAAGRQIALELARSHRVSLSLGSGVSITPQRVLGRDVMVWFDRLGFLRADKATRKGAFAKAHQSFPGLHLRDRALRRRGVRLLARTVGVTHDRFAFAGGAIEPFDAVIWAAGYRDDASWIRVAGALDASGNTIEDRGISPVPGLFYVGRSWQSSRASALLCGVGDDAAGIVIRITEWLRRSAAPSAPVALPMVGVDDAIKLLRQSSQAK